jgi:hypothetical protein
MRTVNVHEAKTQFSRLIDAAHAGETILVAKDASPGRGWCRWKRIGPGGSPGCFGGSCSFPPSMCCSPLYRLRSSTPSKPRCPLDGPHRPAPRSLGAPCDRPAAGTPDGWPEPEGRHVALVRLQLLQDRPCLSIGLIGKALMPLR